MTAPATAKRFPSPDPKVIRHGPMGIPVRGTCVVCGKSFRQPENGRPRKLCRRAKCERERREQLRAADREPEWTLADQDEAEALWGCCALCHVDNEELWFHLVHPPLPVCSWCDRDALNPEAEAWLARVKPGCPLPDPWKGAK